LVISDSYGPSSSPPPPQFSDMKYAFPKTVETFDDVADWIDVSHMFIVCGPGLTFAVQPYFKDHMHA